MRTTKDDKFINDIMEIIDEYLHNEGNANLLASYFTSIATQVNVQIIEMELEKEHTLH